MRIDLQTAYVIHSRHYRDSSLLVDFFTPDYGRVSAVVKGVRATTKAAKQRRSLIQPFIPLLISWGGRSSLKSLFHCEAQSASVPLRAECLFSAMYVNELLMRLVHTEEESHELFSLYQRVILDLVDAESIDSVLRRFEFRLLDYLGYGLSFDAEAESGENINVAQYYQFVPNQGFRLYRLSKPSRDVFSGKDLLAISEDDQSSATRSAAKRLCRLALGVHLGEKPLKSRELFV